ncbi:MAG: 16S rRNA (uracil(1498)-N(3))-methyltransferase [Burkholderiales bacterium]|nr:16S rRNA (uracil(1498)-N(3))-methyltransferase [Burkholderiales bacterium]
MPYFYSETSLASLQQGDTFALSERTFHHAVRVKRMRVNDTLTLFDHDTHAWQVTITDIRKKEAIARAEAPVFAPPPPRVKITLALSVIASDKFDIALQKATELGVFEFRPLVTERSAPFDEKKIAHWRQTIISACEQCQSIVQPYCHPSMRFSDFMAMSPSKTAPVITLDATASLPFADALASLMSSPQISAAIPASVTLMIGAEGGFSDEESAAMKRAGFLSAHLGERILRAETAAIAAVAIAGQGFGFGK